MLAHNIKEVLTIIPEALEFVKQASLELDFPTDNKDSVAASYLTAAYLVKVANKTLDVDLLKKLEKAASLHGIKEQLDLLTPRFSQMTKVASEEETMSFVKAAEAMFEGELCGFLNIEKAAEQAYSLVNQYSDKITSTEVRRYSGQAYLNKEAAIQALSTRHYATKEKNEYYVKIASLVESSVKEDDFLSIRDICKAVTLLDKQAGLDLIGFNFYKEALITKQSELASSLSVTLVGQKVPYTKISALGKDAVSSYMGKDIGNSLNGDPCHDKSVLESLPRDLQSMLLNILKRV
jgi:hypothetical protein